MIYIASDHAGYELKKQLTQYVTQELKQKIQDMGPSKYDENDDYPDYVKPVANKVLADPQGMGVLICGSGQGVCMVANRIKGIRAALAYSLESAESARKEDDANILCLAGRVLSREHANAILKKFIETKFDAREKRVRRVEKIDKIAK